MVHNVITILNVSLLFYKENSIAGNRFQKGIEGHRTVLSVYRPSLDVFMKNEISTIIYRKRSITVKCHNILLVLIDKLMYLI